MKESYEQIVARFVANIHHADNGCYEWQGKIQANGYGYFGLMGKNMLAHRVSYILFKDVDLPDTYAVHHTCHNKSCVNPKHLKAMFKRDHYLMHRKERQQQNAKPKRIKWNLGDK